MVFRRKVLVGGGQAGLVLLALAACTFDESGLALPPIPVTYTVQVDIYACINKNQFDQADWDAGDQTTADQIQKDLLKLHQGPADGLGYPEVQVPGNGWVPTQGQGQAAYIDDNTNSQLNAPWQISSVDNLPVDPSLWPDKSRGPNWKGADWISTINELAKPNLFKQADLTIALRKNVRAVYLAVDRYWLAYPDPANPGKTKSIAPAWFTSGDYVRMTPANSPSTAQMIYVGRPTPAYPLELEIWKYKLDPRDDANWPPAKDPADPTRTCKLWKVPALGTPGTLPHTVNYLLIIEPTATFDCGKSCQNTSNFLASYSHQSDSYADGDNKQNQDDAKNKAESWAEDQFRSKSGYPLGSFVGVAETPVPNYMRSTKSLLTEFNFQFQPWGFPVESVIGFDPAIAPSSAAIAVQGKSYQSSARGTLHFHYTLDSNGHVPLLTLGELRMDLDPLATDVGNFHDVSVVMLKPADAVTHDPILPLQTPADHYSIAPRGLVASLSAHKNGDVILVTAQNQQNVDFTINQNADPRTFTFAPGSTMTASIKLDGKDVTVDLSGLTGYFKSFAPVAGVGSEFKRISECGEGGRNISQLGLDASKSFTLYGPVPVSNPAQYSWFENYGAVVQKLWGQGKTLLLPPYQLGYGVHRFTLVLRDDHGIVATNTADLTVQDTLPPLLDIPPDVVRVVPAGRPRPETHVLVPIDLGKASASDSGNPHVAITNDAPDDLMFPRGTTNVAWTADDGHGNMTQKVQHVSVIVLEPGAKDRETLVRAVRGIEHAVQVSGVLRGTAITNPNTVAELASLRAALHALREAIEAIALPADAQAARAGVVRELDALERTMKEQRAALSKARQAAEQIAATRAEALGALNHAADVLQRGRPAPKEGQQ
jgi:hypothetical protein